MRSLPRGPVLLDTSGYIRFIRNGSYLWLAQDRELFQRTILTVVVAAELYAGTRSSNDKLMLDRLCEAHRALGKLSAPPLESWLLAGVLLQRYTRLYGKIGFTHHFRDILIALEAVAHDAMLLTENARDFFRWRSLLRAAGRNLKVFDLRKLSEG